MFPTVLTEDETIERCKSESIARFGDGELRVAIGGKCVSQDADKRLARELVAIMANNVRGLLVGVPNFKTTARRAAWAKWAQGPYTRLYAPGTVYASAFITRPDSAPHIDRPDYWEKVRDLWRDRDVVLVRGDEKSLTRDMMKEARNVREVIAPRQNAWREVDRIQEEIGTPSASVLLCLGCTATALAARLHRKGVHALDLGHMGMFMKHAGAYQFERSHLATEDYRGQLQQKHASINWGKSGHSHAPEIRKFCQKLEARTVLDYGCGRGTLAGAMAGFKVFEYDPGIVGKDDLPKPADIVACTDVLEHIEPDLLDNVLRHIFLLAKKGAYLVIATRPAREILPDGRNAHLIVQDAPWWISKLKQQGWKSIRHEMKKGLCVWVEK